MLVLTSKRLALLALDQDLAALQASSRSAFFNAIAATHEPIWPPLPFEPHALDWSLEHLAHDPEGRGWYGWVLLANSGERAPPRLAGMAGLVGRPDDDGDVELVFAFTPEFRNTGYGEETVRALTAWAFANGARRVVAHIDAEDVRAARPYERNGFADIGEPPYPGVARWALSAAA